MCGLFGVVDTGGPIMLERAQKCLDSLESRGPNGAGVWKANNIFIGHRRLSIIDLSKAGSQPMESDKAVITVNGEIYNFKSLRDELKQHYRFQSESDSEVVLHGYHKWGMEGLCSRLDGMYALVIYDKQSSQIHLVRDRAGIKPLYYAHNEGKLIWASELGPIADYLQLNENDIDPESILDFATYRFIPAPKSLYRNVYKLPAANSATFNLSTQRLKTFRYWDLQPVEANGSVEEFLEEARSLLDSSIQQQLVSDVPLGCFLSGGIDSGLIAALSLETIQDLPTFSIGFDDEKYDESRLIKTTGHRLGVVNHLKMMDPEDSAILFDKLRFWYGEPFADFSSMPTYQLCDFTSEQITVALSGDGADELFAGYLRYLVMHPASNMKALFNPGTKAFGWLKRHLGWNLAGRLTRWLEVGVLSSASERYCLLNGGLLKNETSELARYLGIANDYDRYWCYRQSANSDFKGTAKWRYVDLCSTLPDMLLAKVDRLSMQCSLEVRVPYLSKQLIEFAFTLPDEVLIKNGQPKGFLRQLASEYLPDVVTEAPKRGFGIPKHHRLSNNNKRCSAQFKVLSELFPELKVEKYIK